jgi:hypothetical protein
MFIIRFILLVFLGLLGRRIYLALKSSGSRRSGQSSHRPAGPATGGPQQNPQGMEDLTEQDISDADFEEIP